MILRPDGNLHNKDISAHSQLAYGVRLRIASASMLGATMEIAEFRNMPDVAKRLHDPPVHDAVYMARRGHITGHIDIHEMAWDADGAIWFINTLFSAASACSTRSRASGTALAVQIRRGPLRARIVAT